MTNHMPEVLSLIAENKRILGLAIWNINDFYRCVDGDPDAEKETDSAWRGAGRWCQKVKPHWWFINNIAAGTGVWGLQHLVRLSDKCWVSLHYAVQRRRSR